MKDLIKALQSLRTLNSDIFACFLQPDYPDNLYLYERRIHQAKLSCLQAIERVQETALQEKLWRLFENILDYAQLRCRVSDHATFTVCRDELLALQAAGEQLYVASIKRANGKTVELNLQAFETAINALETSYHQVLQIAAREPLVFLLFIFSMKWLQSQWQTLFFTENSLC